MNKTLKGYLIGILVPIAIFIIIFWVIFGLDPTKETVDNYLKENSCNPYDIETNEDDEYYCAYYQMRRMTTKTFGKVYSIPWWWFPPNFFLYVWTPFHYYNYIDPSSFEVGNEYEFHVYVSVDTRDKGALIYNPVNGKYIGTFDEVTESMVPGTFKVFNPDTKEYIGNRDRSIELLENKRKVTTTKTNSGSNYECSYNKYNCADFRTQAEAQRVFRYCGVDDIHYLDGDDDGIACESLGY